MRRLLSLGAAIVIGAACLHGAQPAAPAFDGANAYEHVRQVVAIGPRPAGSPGAAATRAYITKQLTALGIKTEEQAFEASTPIGKVKMVNLRATIPGSGSTRIIIAGHYDTKIFREFPFVGANDGGSSTAFLIEFARALKGRTNAHPIELLFLDGEEATGDWRGTDHTYGSRYYVSAARKDNTLKDIHAMILVDMIGDRDLVVKRESNSTPWLTNAIWAAAKRIKQPAFSDETTTIEDDHLEFLEAGVPSVDLIDLEYYTRSGEMAWHSRHDTLENVSARSLQAVGDVLLAALPDIDKRR
jgi:Zn-dependent M28 family amino/carboxypeptidase